MKKIIILLNHDLLEAQIDELKSKFKINKFIYIPTDLKHIWSEIIECASKEYMDNLEQIKKFIKSNTSKNDLVLVQGEYGYTFNIVDFCFNNNLIPIYSFSKRVYKEQLLNNTQVLRQHVFEHICFNKYFKR